MGECVVASVSAADGDSCDCDWLVGANVLVCIGGYSATVVKRDRVAGLNTNKCC